MEREFGKLVEPLRDYVQKLLRAETSSERMAQLQLGADFISAQLANGDQAQLTFICTHNSRRSHFGHVWADTAAKYYGLAGVRTYSGGTEVTACNERTVGALRRAGFSVVMSTQSENPIYLVQGFEAAPPIECFSKIYSGSSNPNSEFAAIICCSYVDENCPVVDGAAIRISLHYDDPQVADDTTEETSQYNERCMQIGRDMFLMMAMASQ